MTRATAASPSDCHGEGRRISQLYVGSTRATLLFELFNRPESALFLSANLGGVINSG
jgi:hypothetical protein